MAEVRVRMFRGGTLMRNGIVYAIMRYEIVADHETEPTQKVRDMGEDRRFILEERWV